MRYTGKARVIGAILLAGTVGGGHAAAQDAEQVSAFDPLVNTVLGADDVLDANDEGFLRENIDDDEAFEAGIDVDESGALEENEVLGEDVDDDEALAEDEVTAGFNTLTNVALGNDDVLDANDEGYLRENVDDDEVFEAGIDVDESGALEENEVLGEDVNEDEALTEDEFLGDPLTNAVLGDDAVLDANDEGFLRENVDDDEAFEAGIDVDDSGALEEGEVLGEDLNEDEALTEGEITADTDALTTVAFGNDDVLDENDEGFLREDLNDDEVFEAGVDADGSGVLEEDEVLGRDVNDDEVLTQDEVDL